MSLTGLCKDVQMIHRVECRVSSGLRNSVGDLCKGLSSTSLFLCDLTKGMTTNKLLYFHFMPLRWPGMKAWLVATSPHCSLQSTPASTKYPLWNQDAFKQHSAEPLLISILYIQ